MQPFPEDGKGSLAISQHFLIGKFGFQCRQKSFRDDAFLRKAATQFLLRHANAQSTPDKNYSYSCAHSDDITFKYPFKPTE